MILCVFGYIFINTFITPIPKCLYKMFVQADHVYTFSFGNYFNFYIFRYCILITNAHLLFGFE